MATEKSRDEEMRELVLDENNNVRWDAIRGEYFKKLDDSSRLDSSWCPDGLWIDSDSVRVWDILLEEGILSTKIDGNHLVLGAGMTLNPRSGRFLYFTKEEDAREYVDLEYGGATYEVYILKCQKIQKKSDLTSPQ